ncbi:hypothetical protein GGQ84_001231 [Desulfitispora alkaliphila]|uniref:YlxM family DNA-binding protein n=1 Tax=Desulfitispora alkaliphila TaxID=622674 RepID=UPI003D1A2AE1
MQDIQKVNRLNVLFDFYGELLTEKQKDIFALYYHQDWSMGEIAEYYKISRPAVHDLLKRVERQLQQYEEKLKLVDKYITLDKKLIEIEELLGEYSKGASAEEITVLKKLIKEISLLERE